VIKEKEKSPSIHDDLIGRLITAQIRPGHLSHNEAIGIVELLLQAGHETTANMTTMGLLSLLQSPEAFEEVQLASAPAGLRNAIEELLRYQTVVQFVGARVALEDVEIAGEVIRAGDGVLAMIDAANHDPAIFERPHQLSLGRDFRTPHMAFGFGIHQCLGQPLARLEMEVVFGTLLRRIPSLTLACKPEELKFKKEALVHGLVSLPVTW
jgi:cytochrome P450